MNDLEKELPSARVEYEDGSVDWFCRQIPLESLSVKRMREGEKLAHDENHRVLITQYIVCKHTIKDKCKQLYLLE